MKIITDDAVYIQKNDFAYLNQTDLAIPASVYLKAFDRGVVVIGDHNRYDFFKFTDSDAIEFFKGLDWILDYYDVKDLSFEDIVEVVSKMDDERREIASKFNLMTPEEKRKNIDMYYRSEYLDFKFCSLRDFVWFRQGKLKFNLPEGVSYPDTDFGDSMIRNSENSTEEEQKEVAEEVILQDEEVCSQTESDKGIKKLFKTIFKRRK